MSAHTAGPLEHLGLVLDEGRAGEDFRLRDALRRAFGLDTTRGARRADRLMAAAPELEAALRAMVQHATTCGACKGTGGREDSEGNEHACRDCGGIGEICEAQADLAAARAALARLDQVQP